MSKQMMVILVPILGTLCGCAETMMTEPVQMGNQKYQIGGTDETSNMAKAQKWCRAKGYLYAELSYTDRGLYRWDADKTTFFCMKEGDTIIHHPSNDVNVDVFNW